MPDFAPISHYALQVPKHQIYPHANSILPAIRLRAARRRHRRLRAVAVPQALRPALYPAGLLERPIPATPRHPSRVRQRCILRSTAAGFSANDSFLSAALSPHPSSFGDSHAEGGERFGLRLGQMRHALSDFFVPLAQYGLLAHGAASFGFSALQSWSDRFLESTLSHPPSKSVEQSAHNIKGEWIRCPRFHGDDAVEIYTWFRMAGLIATVWIPAFAGMTG